MEEDQKLKVILGYQVSFRPAWATADSGSIKPNRQGTEMAWPPLQSTTACQALPESWLANPTAKGVQVLKAILQWLTWLSAHLPTEAFTETGERDQSGGLRLTEK